MAARAWKHAQSQNTVKTVTIMSDNNLTTLINQLVEEKTFSLEAVEAIKEIRNKAEKLEIENVRLNEKIDTLIANNVDLAKRLRRSEESYNVASEKINFFEDQEKKAKHAIYEAEKHKAVADAFKEAMTIVFKPNSVRESITRTVPVVTKSNYPNAPDNVQSFNQFEIKDISEG
jgi:hypothetical protein